MKTSLAQLETLLKNKLHPVYLVSGDDITLKLDAVSMIRRSAKAAGFTQRQRFSQGYEWEQLYSQLFLNSMFAEKRLLEFDFRNENPTKVASSVFETYAENPVKDNLLIIDLPKLDFKITKSAWYISLEKIGVAIPTWPLTPQELPQWIAARVRKYKMQINPEAMLLLSQYVAGNLGAAAQALEKMYLYLLSEPAEKKIISKELIQEVLCNDARHNVFDFIEYLIAGETDKVLQSLSNLQTQGTEPVIILWSITRELRLLIEYKEQLHTGVSMETLFQKYKIYYRRQPTLKQVLNSISMQKCLNLLASTIELDKSIKGIGTQNIWQALQMFCVKFKEISNTSI